MALTKCSVRKSVSQSWTDGAKINQLVSIHSFCSILTTFRPTSRLGRLSHPTLDLPFLNYPAIALARTATTHGADTGFGMKAVLSSTSTFEGNATSNPTRLDSQMNHFGASSFVSWWDATSMTSHWTENFPMNSTSPLRIHSILLFYLFFFPFCHFHYTKHTLILSCFKSFGKPVTLTFVAYDKSNAGTAAAAAAAAAGFGPFGLLKVAVFLVLFPTNFFPTLFWLPLAPPPILAPGLLDLKDFFEDEMISSNDLSNEADIFLVSSDVVSSK